MDDTTRKGAVDRVALLTPLVAILTMAGTLAFQTWQFLISERDKREEALDARWQDAVKTISGSSNLSPGLIALQEFLRVSRYREYREQAKDLAVNIMESTSDQTVFRNLFNNALAPLNWSDLNRAVALDRQLLLNVQPVWRKAWNQQTNQTDTGPLSDDEKRYYDFFNEAVWLITPQIGGVLRMPGRPPEKEIDLSFTYFNGGDWNSIDFDGANLEGMWVEAMDLRNAALKGVTGFTGVKLQNTAWWEVNSINKEFLDYLQKNCPFSLDMRYGPKKNNCPKRAAIISGFRRAVQISFLPFRLDLFPEV